MRNNDAERDVREHKNDQDHHSFNSESSDVQYTKASADLSGLNGDENDEQCDEHDLLGWTETVYDTVSIHVVT